MFPRILAILLLASALAGCAGVDVSHDYDPATDFSGYRSFDWFPGGRQLTGDVELDSPLIDERIRAALVRTLTSRGYQKVADRMPDFFVNYHLSVRTRLSNSGMNTHYGVGIGTAGSWGGVGISTGSRVRQYEEGTLVVDVVDASSRKLVWRGTGSRAIRRDRTPDEATRNINAVVEEILKRFPPQP
jgi:hypothetical protein